MQTTSKSLARLQNEVAMLQRQLRRRKSDRDFEEDGGVVYYGLDSDVITMITAPWLQIFMSNLFTDRQEAEVAFAFLFGEFVLKRHTGQPFLIVSPTENELEGLWNKV